jgi:type III restriction enzyme
MAFLTRHLLEVCPNPWTAFVLGREVVDAMRKRYNENIVANNFVFIIEELRKLLFSEKDRLAKEVFFSLLKKGQLRFMMITKDLGFNRLPKNITLPGAAKRLNREDGDVLQRSLFEALPVDDFNPTLERPVAWYLDEQDRLFFWYRNQSRQDYYIQGWRKNKIYPDFIFTDIEEGKKNSFRSVFVVETKGIQLSGNPDTEYKQSIFDVCNEKAQEKQVEELPFALRDKEMRFEVVFGNEWKAKLNELLY